MDWPLLVIKVSLLFLMGFGLALVLRRSAAATRHWLWSGLFAAVVALPALTATLPGLEIPLPAGWRAAAIVDAYPSAARRPDLQVGQTTSANLEAGSAYVAPPADLKVRPTYGANVSSSMLLLSIWLTGALAALGALALSLCRLRRLSRTARDVGDPAWQAAAGSISSRLGLRMPARLVMSPDVDTPMAGGLWRPIVFVPESAGDWSVERRDIVLTHELAHLAGRDPLRHVLARVALALYWFHPLAWMAATRASAAREAACDEAVIATGVRRSTYARILLELSERAGRSSVLAGALPIVQRSHLERRLMTILNGQTQPAGRMAAISAIGAVMLALSIAAAKPMTGTPGTPGTPGTGSAPAQQAQYAVRYAPAQTPAAAASAAALSCRGESGSSGTSIETSTRISRIRIEDTRGDTRVCVVAEGISSPGTERPSQFIGRADRAMIETQVGSTVHNMEITRPSSGGARTIWRVNGVERPVDAAAEAWRTAALATIDTAWEMSSLRGQVSTLEGEISTIQGQRSTLHGEISTLHGEVSTLQGKISTLQGEDSTLRGRISTIEGQLSVLRGAISSEQGPISSLRAAESVVSTDAARAAIKAELASRLQNVARIEQEVREFNAAAKIDAVQRERAAFNLEAKVAEVRRAIEAFNLNGKIADIERKIRALNVDGEIGAIQRKIQDLNVDRRAAELGARRNAEIEKLKAAIAAIK